MTVKLLGKVGLRDMNPLKNQKYQLEKLLIGLQNPSMFLSFTITKSSSYIRKLERKRI